MMLRGLLILVVIFFGVFTAPTQTVNINGKSGHITWLGNLPPNDGDSIDVLSISGADGLIVRDEAILRSEDGGLNWKVQAKIGTRGAPGTFGKAWFNSRDLLYVLYSNKLFVSHNLGSTWIRRDHQPKGFNYLSIGGNRENGLLVLVGGKEVLIPHKQWLLQSRDYTEDAVGGLDTTVFPAISISRDHGRTWQDAKMYEHKGYLVGIKMSGRYGVAWGKYSIYATTDGGLSWKAMEMQAPDFKKKAYPISATVADGLLWVSLENGEVLRGLIEGNELFPLVHPDEPVDELMFFDTCIGFGTFTDRKDYVIPNQDFLVRTEDGGITWTSVSKLEGMFAFSANGGDLYGVTQDRVFRIAAAKNQTTRSCSRGSIASK